jgi:hypothetical protein
MPTSLPMVETEESKELLRAVALLKALGITKPAAGWKATRERIADVNFIVTVGFVD